MGILAEIHIRARHVVGPVIGVCAVGYFAYHAVHGGRGLLAWQVLEQRVAELRTEAAAVREDRETLERRVRLLHPGSLDADMLDEAARRMLNYGHPDDLVIVIEQGADP